MCFSSKAMEHQASRMIELIQKKSVYKVVKTNFTGDKSSNSDSNQTGRDMNFASQIVLEDSDGKKYDIEPDFNGLKFAKGEITYHEYKKLEKNEKIKGLRLLLASTSVYLMFGGTLLWYLY